LAAIATKTVQSFVSAADEEMEVQPGVHALRGANQPHRMSRRRQTSLRTKILEGCPALGAALGLVSTHTDHAARSLSDSAMPYVTHAIAGAVLGGGVAVALILLWRWRSPGRPATPAAPRREAVPERVRHEVWRRDRGSCVECGSRARLEFDHIIPVSRGGSNTARNIELRCEPCNRRKGARI
jgi:HNH endonuclease